MADEHGESHRAGPATATAHLLLGLWAALLAGVPMTVLTVTSFALAPVVPPVLTLPPAAATRVARLERRRFRAVLGVSIVEPPPLPAPAGGRSARWRARLSDTVGWRQTGYFMLRLPLSAAQTVLVLAIWLAPLAALTLPVYNWALPNGGAALGFGVTVRSWWSTALVWLLGAVLLVSAPRLVRGLTAMDVAWTQLTLGQGSLAARVADLERSHARLVEAAETERRRIERNLHDGAQQRLVALAMLLARARARHSKDPTAAGDLLDQAHAEAKLALTELRELVRGLHPAVLTELGLDAALSGLAARSPVPVQIEVDLGADDDCAAPPRVVEAVAYFVAAEALANVAKHARATRASVVVRRVDGGLRLVVTDDGAGGADPAAGTGLRGLADRVAGVDGTMQVSSPVGGPTLVTVELPCGS